MPRKTGLKLKPAASNTSKNEIRYRNTQSRSFLTWTSLTADRKTIRWASADAESFCRFADLLLILPVEIEQRDRKQDYCEAVTFG